MIAFTPLRTKRLNVQLRELTIGDAIFLCKLPPESHEYGTTEFLRRVVLPDEKPKVGQVSDPSLWTVQERGMAVAHYLAHTTADPNFTLGEARFSDYIFDGNNSAPEKTAIGECGGDKWFIRPLTGLYAESIERLVQAGKLADGRTGWWFGAMAAQLLRADDAVIDHSEQSADTIDEYIASRAEVYTHFPETEFMQLLQLFLTGMQQIQHLLRATFTDEGVVFEAREGAGFSPARFPVGSCVSEGAVRAFGNTDQ